MENKETKAPVAQPKKSNKTFIIVLVLLVIGGGSFGFTKYIHAKHHTETDDAQIEANISPVIPRISGYVAEVRVKDNQFVKEGDTLLILDNRDQLLKLHQAEAALSTAESNLSAAKANTQVAQKNIASSQAGVAAVAAQIETAKVNVWRATKDFERYENLIKDHSITQQQYEQALAAKQTAERQLEVLKEQQKQAASNTTVVASQSYASNEQAGVVNSTVQQRLVDIEEAKLHLSYTVITAPQSGLISKVNVQPGQFLNAGQSTFSIVLNQDKWVVANFKETQLDKMKIGQTVIVHVDAFPEHEFQAKLESFSPATGARFALLPPDNASGNFVKVVQRVPVKIEFVDQSDAIVKQLRAGMNVQVDVHLD